jgi:hypothetical protein
VIAPEVVLHVLIQTGEWFLFAEEREGTCRLVLEEEGAEDAEGEGISDVGPRAGFPLMNASVRDAAWYCLPHVKSPVSRGYAPDATRSWSGGFLFTHKARDGEEEKKLNRPNPSFEGELR